MIACPHCGKRLSSQQLFCPACSNDVSTIASVAEGPAALADEPVDDISATVVARFQNAAEAGYFADELLRKAQIPATVALAEDRDSLHGSWCTRFHLLVPDAQAERAAVALERLVVESESDEWIADEEIYSDSAAAVGVAAFHSASAGRGATEVSPVNWLPIVLTLTAGSAAFWGLRQIDHAPRVHQPAARERMREEDLRSHFLNSPDPWMQRIGNGPGLRELRIDRNRNVVVIREDADGDGFFETQSIDTIESLRR